MPERFTWPNETIIRSSGGLVELRSVCEGEFAKDSASLIVQELGRYLTVRSCGHIEIVAAESIREFIWRHSSAIVANYATSSYKDWRSPKAENLKKVLQQFSPQLANDFKAYLQSGDRDYASDLGSMVSARDKIAHGQNDQVNMLKAMDYCKSAIHIADWYISRFAPGGLADSLQCHQVKGLHVV